MQVANRGGSQEAREEEEEDQKSAENSGEIYGSISREMGLR